MTVARCGIAGLDLLIRRLCSSQHSSGRDIVLPGMRFVALLRPEMMTGTALKPPLGAA
jgi:hypothetical protein